MHALRRRFRPAAWLAAGAVLLLALLPALGQAWSTGQGGWTLVCSPQGPRWVALGEDGGAPAALQAAGDCAACLWSATPLPPAAEARLLAPSVVAVADSSGTATPAPRTAWHPAAPRGPPAG